MDFATFLEHVEAMWARIPESFKRELQGVHVAEEAKEEPDLPGQDVWRLGEYLDPGPPSVFAGFEGLGRHIVLYYGSFRKVAAGDPGFDWEAEIWETLLHELQHHVESLAGRDDLVQEDLAQLRELRREGTGD